MTKYVCTYVAIFDFEFVLILCQVEVSDLNFNTYSSVENLRAEEKACVYPPRFKASVDRLSHDKDLNTVFKINLENNGVSDFDEVIPFPLIIEKSTAKMQPSKILDTYYVAIYISLFLPLSCF